MRRYAVYIVLAVILAVLIIWRFGVNSRQQAAQVQAASMRRKMAPAVRVAPAVTRDIVHTFQGIGNVVSPNDVPISSKVTGRLTYLVVREGASVTRGEVLARIDPSEIQAAINQQQAAVTSAEANYANAQVSYRRYWSLYRQGFVAAQDIDNTRTQVAVQRASLNAARAQLHNLQYQLADTILRSPINGFVTARYMDPGAVATAGQPIVAVQAIRRVYIMTSVPETVNQDVRPGMTARAVFDAMPGRTFTGKVASVNPAADPQSRQFLVRTVFNNPQGLIKPNMYCTVTVVTHITRNATVVPHEAISRGPRGSAGSSVMVVGTDRIARRIPVRIVDQDPAGAAVTGILPGQRVIVLSAQPVRDGQMVRIDNSGAQGQFAVAPNMVGGGGGGGAAGTAGRTGAGGGANAPSYGAPSGAGATAGGGASFTGGGGASSTGRSGTTPTAPSVTPQMYNGAPGAGTSGGSQSFNPGTPSTGVAIPLNASGNAGSAITGQGAGAGGTGAGAGVGAGTGAGAGSGVSAGAGR